MNVGNEATKQLIFLKSIQNRQSSVDFYRKLSVMVVGEKGVGKTSFIKTLVGSSWKGDTFASYDITDDYDDEIENTINNDLGDKKLNKNKKKELKNSYRKNITDGIDINLWRPQGKNIDINLFDFAGQEIYYNTHQFFLCKESVYLLLFNGSKNMNQNRLAYWLHTIITKAPSATLFIIATHSDNQNAERLREQHSKELISIIDNIHFIYPHCKLNIIYPKDNQQQNDQQNPVKFAQPYWEISNKKKLFASGGGINRKDELTNEIVHIAEYEIANRTANYLPSSWIEFRSYLKMCTECVENKMSNGTKVFNSKVERHSKLLSRDGLAMIDRKDAQTIAMEEFSIQKSSLDIVIGLLSSWGEVIVLNNPRKDFHVIVTRPEGLIGIFKYFISARRFAAVPMSSTPSLSRVTSKLYINKLKNSDFDINSLDQLDDKKYLVTKSQVLAKFQSKFPLIDDKELNGIVDRTISLLIEVRLIYPISSTEYFIPSLLRGKKIPKEYSQLLHEFYNLNAQNIINNSFSTNNEEFEDPNEFIHLERRYEFTYLPSGLFTRIMIDICHWKTITDEHIWENGLLIEGQPNNNTNNNNNNNNNNEIELSNNNNNFTKKLKESSSFAILLLETNNIDISATIKVLVWSKRGYCGDLLPHIHCSILGVIQSLEFENKTQIYCSVYLNTANYILFNYNHCLLMINQYNNSKSDPTVKTDNSVEEKILRFLIPEFYQLSKKENQQGNLYIEESRFHCEVREVQKIGSGASGEVWKGRWFNQTVAIKKPIQLESFEICSIISEVSLLKSLNHPNLLKLLDVYQSPLAIVTDLCTFGDLDNLIKKNSVLFQPFLSLKILRDISSALGYLHTHSPPIIHCDVRLPNIFMKSLHVTDHVRFYFYL